MTIPAFDTTMALIVVDVQNDFALPSGSLYVSGGEAVVPYLNDVVGTAEDAVTAREIGNLA